MNRFPGLWQISLGILSFILLLNGVSAYSYINIYLDSSGRAVFLGQTNETNQTNQTFPLPTGIIVQDGQISGTTQSLTTKSNATWKFSYSLKGAEMKVILPPGSTLENIDQGQIFLERERIAVYSKDRITISYIIPDAKSDPTSLIAVLVIVVLALAILSYNYRKKIRGFLWKKGDAFGKKSKAKRKTGGKEEETQRKLELIKQILNQREKSILENLEIHRKIKMSQLRKLTDIPKASFSRHIQELEKKGIVRRTGEGKNKFVEIIG